MKFPIFGSIAEPQKTRRYSGKSCNADDFNSFVSAANFSARVKNCFNAVSASPASFRVSLAALVASMLWAAGVLVWGL